jgi:hypothetical protein
VAPILAAVFVAMFWGLLWAGAAWAAPDSRDGRDWHERGTVNGHTSRTVR